MAITDKNFYSDYHFLLNSFTPGDIDAVMHDLDRSFDEYNFLYILDTYDILENYLPYTQGELFSKREMNYQAQKYICYDYFFGGFNKTNTILLEEYKIELLAAKNKLNRQLREASTVITNLKKLKKETEGFINNPEKAEDFFNENLEVILLLLILNDKTNNILEEFFLFIKNRLHIAEVKISNQKDHEIVNRIFASCKHTKFAVTLFTSYIDENKVRLLLTDDLDKRHVYLENTFRDVQAIERVMRINEMFVRHDLKYVAVYLSSANKTPEIFKALAKKQSNGTTVNARFYRNIYQYFLFDRIKSEYKDKPAAAMEILGSLRELLFKIANDSTPEPASSSQKKDNQDVLAIVKALFDEKSNNIDNHFYLSIYEKYKNMFDNVNAPNPGGLDRAQIIKILDQIEKKKELLEVRSFDLKFSLSQLNQTYDIVDTFTGLDDFEPDYRYGSDIVRNPYQHLPILLMVNYPLPGNTKRALYKFLNYNVESGTDKAQLKAQLKIFVTDLSRLPAADLKFKFIKSILITYINLVAQSKTNNVTYNLQKITIQQLEEIIISDLERQYEVIKFQFSKYDPIKTDISKKVEFTIDNPALLIEIAYLLLWLYRRNNREAEGIEKFREISKITNEDPRLFQGVGLCYISQLYKLVKQNEHLHRQDIEVNTDLAYQYLKIAREKYQSLLNGFEDEIVNQAIMKNYIAVLNSLADLSIRKYETSSCKDFSLVETARNFINEIKLLFDTIDLIYDQYPTYSATEFEIEYYEALFYYNNNELSRAHQKIINAITRESALKTIPDSQKYVDEVFLNKSSKLNELATRIFKNFKR